MGIKALAAAAIVLLATSSWAADDGPKKVFGGLGGAALGGLLGAQFGSGAGQLIFTGAGVLIGALVGSEVGRSLDEIDRMKANEAIQRARTARIGESIHWNNPRSGNSGSITPVRNGQSESGLFCREFRQEVVVGGKRSHAYGIACRQDDGTWRVLQE